MLLWHKEYFELKEIEKQQTEEELSALPSFCLKAGHMLPFVKVFPSPFSCTRKRMTFKHWR